MAKKNFLGLDTKISCKQKKSGGGAWPPWSMNTFVPAVSSPHKLTHFHIGIFLANPVSFFPDSPSFDHNCSEPRRTNRVRLSYENPSDPFGFAEARTRKLGLWWEFLELGFLGSLRRMRVWELCVSAAEENKSGFGLYGTVSFIGGF